MNIRQVVFKSPVTVALENADRERQIVNGEVDPRKFLQYHNAVSALEEFICKGKRGSITVDDVKDAMSFHSVIVDLDNDEFDKTEIKQFTDILNMFDGMMIYGDSKGNTSFSLIMEDIYKEQGE